MSSENNEKKVLSRREALKRIAVAGAGVVAVAATGISSAATCYGSYASYTDGGAYYSQCFD